MKVSVIMAVFNGEKKISSAIESILNQTYKNFEFIIIDDGSRDQTYAILRNYVEKDKRIRVFRNSKNIGLTKSLNFAIKKSKLKYIARQDVDDESLPNRLETQLKFLEENPEYSFCGTNGYIKNNNKKFVKYFDIDEIIEHLIYENCFAHPSIMIKREIFEKTGYYRERFKFGQDYELWNRLIYKHNLKGINLQDLLIILDTPINTLLDKNKRKVLLQLLNAAFTTLKYLRYSSNKIGGLKSLFRYINNAIYIFLHLNQHS